MLFFLKELMKIRLFLFVFSPSSTLLWMVTVLCVCLTTKMLFALLMLKCIKVTSNSGSLMTNRRLLHQLYRAGERRRWQNQMYLWWITTTRQLFSSFFVLLIYLTTCTKNWWALLCCDYFVSCFWIIIQGMDLSYHFHLLKYPIVYFHDDKKKCPNHEHYCTHEI